MPLYFFLGGRDLEMATIAALLTTQAAGHFLDKGLPWGAKASAYWDEIVIAQTRGDTPVLVELENDLGLTVPDVIFVDHHGSCAGANKPTSLEQVFHLLGLPPAAWTPWYDLVAANDRGHIRALRSLGAADADVRSVRREEWRVQGITDSEVAAAQEALSRREEERSLIIVTIPHERSTLIADLIDPAFGGTGMKNLFVVSPNQVNFQGEGRVVVALSKAFPGGWLGGELPAYGFWGHDRSGLNSSTIKQFILGIVAKD